MRKGQGLSMNVIIIAAISLLVLVILAVLVIRASVNVSDNTGCTGIGGQCVQGNPFLENPCGELGNNWQYSAAHQCVEGYVCCINI